VQDLFGEIDRRFTCPPSKRRSFARFDRSSLQPESRVACRPIGGAANGRVRQPMNPASGVRMDLCGRREKLARKKSDKA
jgi:hypothetical protein